MFSSFQLYVNTMTLVFNTILPLVTLTVLNYLIYRAMHNSVTFSGEGTGRRHMGGGGGGGMSRSSSPNNSLHPDPSSTGGGITGLSANARPTRGLSVQYMSRLVVRRSSDEVRR